MLQKGVVTIVIPIFKRLHYLAGVLQAIASQDYPHIDLIVSDNGGIGEQARPIIDANYPRPVPAAEDVEDAVNQRALQRRPHRRAG